LSQGVATIEFGQGFTQAEQDRIRQLNADPALRGALGQEFGTSTLEDPVRFERVQDLAYPGTWDRFGSRHIISLRPDMLDHPGTLRSLLGHEYHHAFRYEAYSGLPGGYDWSGAGTAAAERAANRFELRNAARFGAETRYLDYARRLYEWYR